MHYSIFKTRWGWFGLLGDDDGLRRTCLPLAEKEEVLSHLLANSEEAPTQLKTFGDCQEQVKAYFESVRVDFSGVAVDVSGFGAFEQAVWQTIRGISYGQTTTYTDLAARANRPRAIRAAANAVAKNPLPLIIPCHRILRKDRSLGGFSAPGGVDTKKRLLDLENR
jgi:methylated-DNA-[protein]-cysteine S-methyltransferase